MTFCFEWAILKECKKLFKKGVNPEDIGVISFYKAQVRYIKGLLKHSLGEERSKQIEVATVDSFQGEEKKIIFLSATRSNDDRDAGFLNDKRRLNVAFSRAQDQIIIVGDIPMLRRSNGNNIAAEVFEYLANYEKGLQASSSLKKNAAIEQIETASFAIDNGLLTNTTFKNIFSTEPGMKWERFKIQLGFLIDKLSSGNITPYLMQMVIRDLNYLTDKQVINESKEALVSFNKRPIYQEFTKDGLILYKDLEKFLHLTKPQSIIGKINDYWPKQLIISLMVGAEAGYLGIKGNNNPSKEEINYFKENFRNFYIFLKAIHIIDKKSASSSINAAGGIDLSTDSLSLNIRGQASSSSLTINNVPFDTQNFKGFSFKIIEFKQKDNLGEIVEFVEEKELSYLH